MVITLVFVAVVVFIFVVLMIFSIIESTSIVLHFCNIERKDSNRDDFTLNLKIKINLIVK